MNTQSHTHTYIYIYIHTFVCIYIYTHMRTCTQADGRTDKQDRQRGRQAGRHTTHTYWHHIPLHCVRFHSIRYILKYMHAYIHAYILKHVHTLHPVSLHFIPFHKYIGMQRAVVAVVRTDLRIEGRQARSRPRTNYQAPLAKRAARCDFLCSCCCCCRIDCLSPCY